VGSADLVTAASLIEDSLEELGRLVNEEIASGKRDFSQIVDSTASILGDRQMLGSDRRIWREIVQGAINASVAEALVVSVERTSKNPVFTSRGKAARFVVSVQDWFRHEAVCVIRSHVEEAVHDWRTGKGAWALSLDLPWPTAAKSVKVDPPMLPQGVPHGTACQITGALGTLISAGQWGGAYDWAAGDEEFWLGRELNVDFFAKIGQEVSEAAACSFEHSWTRGLEGLRSQAQDLLKIPSA
jgi:hypothetical protein